MLALDIILLVLFCAATVIAPIAWLRMLRAKSQPAYLKNVALFVLPILLVLGIAALNGNLDAPVNDAAVQHDQANLNELTLPQVALLVLAGAVWLGGGSFLFYRHTKRVGRPWFSVMNPIQPPFRDFNAREWTTLGALAAVSLGLGVIAMSLGAAA